MSVVCDVRLVKNVNVSAGLVNSAIGKVVKVICNNADIQLVRDGKHRHHTVCQLSDIRRFR